MKDKVRYVSKYASDGLHTRCLRIIDEIRANETLTRRIDTAVGDLDAF